MANILKNASKRTRFVSTCEHIDGDSAYKDRMILARSFRKISVQAFEFPFTGVSRVREALKIKYRPLLGDASSAISIVPFFAESERRTSSGCVFLLPSEDEHSASSIAECAVWPLPIVFASHINGTGSIVCRDDDIVSSLVLEDWIPKYYDVSESGGTELSDAESAAREIAEALGISGAESFAVDLASVSGEELQRAGERTLAGFAPYASLDLSNRGAEMLEQREKLSSSLLRFGRAVSIAGMLLSLICVIILLVQYRSEDRASSNASDIYTILFGERSSQPLGSARERLRSLSTGGSSDLSMLEVLRSLSSAWDKFGDDAKITIENMRFGTENTDIMGTSESNDLIQSLRSHLEGDGYTPRIDSIQQAPNGLLRFNISITRSTDR